LVNISMAGLALDVPAVAVQIAVALAVPLIAALVPVLGGARISPHKAISTYGLGGGYGQGWLDRLLGKVKSLPRPLALSLRNTFRHKARVMLTLATLAMGGAIFMMVMSVRSSFDHTLDLMLSDFGGDAMVWFDKRYRVSRLVDVSESAPGVSAAEVWLRWGAPMPTQQGERYILLVGVPPESKIMKPRIAEGRMLRPDDGHAIVLNQKIAVEQGIKVGDEISVRFDDQAKSLTWMVVGTLRNAENGQRVCLVPFGVLADQIGSPNKGQWAAVAGEAHTPEAQRQLVRDLRETYRANGIETSYLQTADDMRQEDMGGFNIIVSLLMGMAVLTAVVGGIGLASTMSINVVERRREIGVMRSTGATSPMIAIIFVVEGVLLGLLSSLFAVPISVPGAQMFNTFVGGELFSTPFDFVFSVGGLALWIVIVVVLSTLASLWPALRATRVSVREALAYE
jgi:putative ABC transport system permease protein